MKPGSLTTLRDGRALCVYCRAMVENTDPVHPVMLPDDVWSAHAAEHAAWCEWVAQSERRRARRSGRG